MHPWDVSPTEARAIQHRLAGAVLRQDRLPPTIQRVAGIDVGFEAGGTVTRAAAAVLDFATLTVAETAIARRATAFPYLPGLLSFRELPAVLDALEQIATLPDVILCDGQGIAHPRRLGLAAHLGVLLDLPSVGVAKSRLIGRYVMPEDFKGAREVLVDGSEVIGAVIRSRRGVKPIFVSIGHRVCLDTAVRLTLACTSRYRLPETTRQAHALASAKA